MAADVGRAGGGSAFPERIIMSASRTSNDAAEGEHPDAVPAAALRVRAAVPDDIPVLFEMKRQLAIMEGSILALRATERDWLRDGFGPEARFAAYVAEQHVMVVGMATVSPRYYTGWGGFGLYIQDLFVSLAHRRRGVARALLAQVAASAVERDCPFVELTVADDNPARRLYRRSGFTPVRHSAAYVLGGQRLVDLARQASASAPLRG
jgi:ribosomal protein S18 acetylase RimI-like enzyme